MVNTARNNSGCFSREIAVNKPKSPCVQDCPFPDCRTDTITKEETAWLKKMRHMKHIFKWTISSRERISIWILTMTRLANMTEYEFRKRKKEALKKCV